MSGEMNEEKKEGNLRVTGPVDLTNRLFRERV